MVSKKTLKKVLVVIIAILLLVVIPFVVTKVIYDRTFARYDHEVVDYPQELADLVSSRQVFTYASGDNTLTGYLYESNAPNRQDTLIVLVPGHNACADTFLEYTDKLLDLGWSVFCFDTTGSCSSDGDSSVGFPQTVLDLNATLDYITSRNNLNYADIALLGHSRGGYAVCCALASDYDIAAVVSVSGVNSAMDGIIGGAAQHIGGFAYSNYGYLWLYQAMLFGGKAVNLQADEIISSTDTPVLLVHGAEDATFPLDKYSIISHRDEITNENAEYFITYAPDYTGHADLFQSENVIQKIHEFLVKNTE